MAEKLTPEQKMAVTNRGGKLLVSAAAGSGKTKVLVDRLLSYLTDPAEPANVDDFLIITYTKAAAAELRGKISAKLTERIAMDPDNRHLQQQIQRLYLAKISTVHSFCSDILREYAYRLDLPADFRVADETECREIQRNVLEQVLDNAYETAAENENFISFIDTQGLGRDDRQIPDILLKVYSSAKCHLNPEQWLDWCISAGDVSAMEDAGATVWGRYLISDLQTYLDEQIATMSRARELAERTGQMPKPAALLESAITQMKALRSCNTWDEIAAFPEIEYGRLTFPKNCSDLQLIDQIKAVRNACKKGIEKKLRAFADPSSQVLSDLQVSCNAAKGLIELVREFSRQYEKSKQTRRILDFGDLEHKTLDLLLGRNRTGATAIAREISTRFREIMVDEYQDSNEVQDAIFGALTEMRQNCFMVGDVKQSIYQFRLADPGIFLQKYNSFAPAENAEPGQGRKVLLSRNFRSSGGVISSVNAVFSNCMSPEVGGLHYGEDEMLYEGLAHTPLPEPEVELYGIQVEQDTYAEEAAFVAEKIEQLLDGTHMVRQDDTLRPITLEDIVILLRSPGSVGGEFRYALEQRGIPCTTGDSTDLLLTQEISTLRALLQIIGNPLQDIPLLAVLTSPVFGFTAEELSLMRAQNRRSSIYNVLQEDTSPKSQAFLRTLEQLRQKARLYTISQLLECVFVATGLYSIYAAMEDGDIKTSNLQAFCQLASNYETTGKKDLAHFLEYLEGMEEKGLTVPAEKNSAGAVTIMSIHKSKGLEFPVVILCGLSRSFNQESTKAQVLCHKELGLGLSCVDRKLRVRYPTVAKRAIAAKMTAESISEEMRVLYVAMTRARDRLIMTYAAANLEGQLSDIAMRMDLSSKQLMMAGVDCPGTWVLNTALKRTEAGAFFALGGKPECASVSEIPWKISVADGHVEETSVQVQEQTKLTIPPETIETMKKSLGYTYPHWEATKTPSKQTATQLKGRMKDEEAAEDTAASAAMREFRKPDFVQQKPQGKAFGNATHAVMQYIRYEVCDDHDSVQREVQRLVAQGLISPEQRQIVDTRRIAEFFQTDIGKRLRAGGEILREFKFSLLVDASNYYPNVALEQVLLQGVVDCALVEEDGITVLDFKTDFVTEETFQTRIEQYRAQVSAYADALERIYQKKVKKAYLYFFQIGEFVEILRS